MSNRDGRGSKPNKKKTLFRNHKLCPTCKKGKIEKCRCSSTCIGLLCRTCGSSNF